MGQRFLPFVSCLCTLLALAAADAIAIDIEAAAQYTAEYTTNTLRTETDEIGEWIHRPGVDFSAQEDTATLELDADYSYIRRIYTKDFWQDENRLIGGANIRWQPVESRVDMILRHNRVEATRRALQTSTQDNRQIINTTEAGSTLRFQPRAADELQLEYTFTDIRTDITRTDSQRHTGTGRYIVGLSTNRALTVLSSYSDIEFDTEFFSQARYALVSATYEQRHDTLELRLGIGHNWVEREGRGWTDDPTYDIALTWRPRAGTTITGSASQRITDRSQNLQQRRTSGIDEDFTDINAFFKETLGDLNITQDLGRTNQLSAGIFYARQKFAEDLPRTNTRRGIRVGFSREMTPTSSLSFNVQVFDREFEDRDDQEDLRARLNFRHRVGRSIGVNWGVRYETRTGLTQSFDDWIASAQVYYTFWGARR